MSETPEVTDTPDENVETVEEPKHDRPSEADRRAAERHAETETQRTESGVNEAPVEEAPEKMDVPAEAVEPMPTDPPSEDELNSTFSE